MLIPLELDILAKRCGNLSPGLALGWRIGGFIQEYFNDLEDARIAALTEGDASLALSMMCRKNRFPFPVTIATEKRPWDFLVYHYLTGTVLQFKTVPDYNVLHEKPYWPEDFADEAAALRAEHACVRANDKLIIRILNNPVETYCRIVETRVLFLGREENKGPGQLRCCCCRSIFTRDKLLDSDGCVLCIPCAGLEPSWFEWM